MQESQPQGSPNSPLLLGDAEGNDTSPPIQPSSKYSSPTLRPSLNDLVRRSSNGRSVGASPLGSGYDYRSFGAAPGGNGVPGLNRVNSNGEVTIARESSYAGSAVGSYAGSVADPSDAGLNGLGSPRASGKEKVIRLGPVKPVQQTQMAPWAKLYYYGKIPGKLCLGITLAVLVTIQIMAFVNTFDPVYDCNRDTLRDTFLPEKQAINTYTWQDDDGNPYSQYYTQREVLESINSKIVRYYGLTKAYLMPGFRWLDKDDSMTLKGQKYLTSYLSTPDLRLNDTMSESKTESHTPHHAPIITFRLHHSEQLAHNYSQACVSQIVHIEEINRSITDDMLYRCRVRPGKSTDWKEDPNYLYMEEWTGTDTTATGESTKEWFDIFLRLRAFNISFALKMTNPPIFWNIVTAYTVDIGCGKTTGTQYSAHDTIKDPDNDDPYSKHGAEEIIAGDCIGVLWAIIVLAGISLLLRIKSVVQKTTAWLEEKEDHEVYRNSYRHSSGLRESSLMYHQAQGGDDADLRHSCGGITIDASVADDEGSEDTEWQSGIEHLIAINAWPMLVIITNCIQILGASYMLEDHYMGSFTFEMRFVLALSVILSWACISEFTGFIPKVNLFQTVFMRGGRMLFYHCCGIMPLFMGFTFFGLVLYGKFNYNFHSISVSAVTLFSVVLGDSVKEIYFSLHTTPDSEAWYVQLIGRLYVTSFIVTFIFIILNIATLIIEDAYFTVRTEITDDDDENGNKAQNVAKLATHGGIAPSTDTSYDGHSGNSHNHESLTHFRGQASGLTAHNEKVIDAQQMAYDALLERLVSTENQLAQARRTISEMTAREQEYQQGGSSGKLRESRRETSPR